MGGGLTVMSLKEETVGSQRSRDVAPKRGEEARGKTHKTKRMSLKLVVGLQSVDGQLPQGVPQVVVSGLPLVMSAGIALRCQCHMKIPVEDQRIAKTPPPTAAKPGKGSTGVSARNRVALRRVRTGSEGHR